MENINKYYENTKNALPHQSVKQFIEMNVTPGKAVDLGCGPGRDTIYLIKNGWNVVSIDKENTEKIISDKLEKEEMNRFSFSSQSFEDVILQKNNLIVANFSIPFCNKAYFNEFKSKMINSLSEERIFCRKLFWNK